MTVSYPDPSARAGDCGPKAAFLAITRPQRRGNLVLSHGVPLSKRTGLVYLEGKILTKKLASFMWAGHPLKPVAL